MKRKLLIGIIPALLLACMVFTMTHAPDVYAADPQDPFVIDFNIVVSFQIIPDPAVSL